MHKGFGRAVIIIGATAFIALTAWFFLVRGSSRELDDIRAERLEPIRMEMAAKGLRLGAPVFIRIFKDASELELWVEADGRFAFYKTFPICRWSGALGPKLRGGDGQAPEGFYSVSRQQMNPNSQYHLSFDLGFPNAYDRAQGRTGSFLMVHGNCVSIGCYAMTDRGIEEIWLIADEALKGGQARFDVHVFPFRMTPESFDRNKGSQWIAFWESLKAGYDSFEQTGKVPAVTIAGGAYAIN